MNEQKLREEFDKMMDVAYQGCCYCEYVDQDAIFAFMITKLQEAQREAIEEFYKELREEQHLTIVSFLDAVGVDSPLGQYATATLKDLSHELQQLNFDLRQKYLNS